jgi:hypothetical protein
MKKTVNPLRQMYSVEYGALVNAIHRCHNPKHIAYPNYGARGIEVCPQWRDLNTGFTDFIRHIGARPAKGYSLDRIDNNKGYEPENVRWADRKTQQNNTRKTAKSVTDFGWGIGYVQPTKTARGYGARPSPLIPFDGRVQTLKEWANELGIKPATIRQRLQRGHTPEMALSTDELRDLGNAKATGFSSKTLLDMGFPALVKRLNRVEATMMDRTGPERVARLEQKLDDAIAKLEASINQHIANRHGDDDAR